MLAVIYVIRISSGYRGLLGREKKARMEMETALLFNA